MFHDNKLLFSVHFYTSFWIEFPGTSPKEKPDYVDVT